MLRLARYIHDDDTRKSSGPTNIPDDAAACKDAVNLNNLDDWKEFHQAVPELMDGAYPTSGLDRRKQR